MSEWPLSLLERLVTLKIHFQLEKSVCAGCNTDLKDCLLLIGWLQRMHCGGKFKWWKVVESKQSAWWMMDTVTQTLWNMLLQGGHCMVLVSELMLMAVELMVLLGPCRALILPREVFYGTRFGSKHHIMLQLANICKVGRYHFCITDSFKLDLWGPPFPKDKIKYVRMAQMDQWSTIWIQWLPWYC